MRIEGKKRKAEWISLHTMEKEEEEEEEEHMYQEREGKTGLGVM